MKKIQNAIIVMVVVLNFNGSAQQQAALGRFLIGTTPVSFSIGKETTITQSADYSNINNEYLVQTDTARPSISGITAHINLFVGYFVTKNICAGLQFGSNSTGTYSTFIRYYFCQKKHDSAKVDFFIQANGTYSYSGIDNPAITNYYPYTEQGSEASFSTTEYKTNQTTLNGGIGLAVAFHLTTHWSLEVEAGYIYMHTVQNTGTYTGITTYYPEPSFSTPASAFTLPSLKSTSATNEGTLKFMLSYRI